MEENKIDAEDRLHIELGDLILCDDEDTGIEPSMESMTEEMETKEISDDIEQIVRII